MTTWVVDTSPLIFLSKLGRLNLLQAGADTVCVPQAVMDEIRAKPDEASQLIKRASQSWLTVREVHNRQAVEILLADLGLGEAEVIVLAKELDADRVVMDDLDARRFARRVDLNLVGTWACYWQLVCGERSPHSERTWISFKSLVSMSPPP